MEVVVSGPQSTEFEFNQTKRAIFQMTVGSRRVNILQTGHVVRTNNASELQIGCMCLNCLPLTATSSVARVSFSVYHRSRQMSLGIHTFFKAFLCYPEQ
jgi:hypothetical protein